jgi:hypothetical protein
MLAFEHLLHDQYCVEQTSYVEDNCIETTYTKNSVEQHDTSTWFLYSNTSKTLENLAQMSGCSVKSMRRRLKQKGIKRWPYRIFKKIETVRNHFYLLNSNDHHALLKIQNYDILANGGCLSPDRTLELHRISQCVGKRLYNKRRRLRLTT